MASRVSSSGGWTSVIRPHSKRLRRRTSRVAMALGGRQGGGVGESVGRADDKGLEGVAGVDRQVVWPAFLGGGGRLCDCGGLELILDVVGVVVLVGVGPGVRAHLETDVV